jgi:hypothetical protein
VKMAYQDEGRRNKRVILPKRFVLWVRALEVSVLYDPQHLTVRCGHNSRGQEMTWCIVRIFIVIIVDTPDRKTISKDA